MPAVFLAPAHLEPQRIQRVTSQIDIPPTIMGILGGDYRSAFFGRDVLNHQAGDSFAVVVYNKNRYGIVSDHELVVIAENGGQVSYVRDDRSLWQQAPPAAQQSERGQIGVALLRVAEDLLVSGRYTSTKARSS